MPSRSTMFTPIAAESSSKSTTWSSSRLTSSIYNKPRLAAASTPGSKMTLAVLDGYFDIEGANHAVFGGADGQVDESDAAIDDFQLDSLQLCAPSPNPTR